MGKFDELYEETIAQFDEGLFGKYKGKVLKKATHLNFFMMHDASREAALDAVRSKVIEPWVKKHTIGGKGLLAIVGHNHPNGPEGIDPTLAKDIVTKVYTGLLDQYEKEIEARKEKGENLKVKDINALYAGRKSGMASAFARAGRDDLYAASQKNIPDARKTLEAWLKGGSAHGMDKKLWDSFWILMDNDYGRSGFRYKA
jgi:hypothetical protein